MKKYSTILGAALSIFALASCQKEQDLANQEVVNNGPSSIPFELRANIPSIETKTTLNTGTWAVNWEDTDVIYAVTTDAAWGVAYKDDNSGETIAEFAYDSVNGTFSTDKYIADGSHTFNFLYTAGQQKSYHRGASTTFQLAGAQTFDASDPTASLKLYDALAAQVTATTPTSFADVDMSHLFSLMKVTLKNRTGNSMTINKFEIEIPGQNLYGIFNVNFASTPSVSYNKSGGDKITVNISNGSVANNDNLDVYFVMGPVSDYTGDVTFKVTDSADNTYTKKNTISSAVTFAAGTYNTASYSLKTVDPPMFTSWVKTPITSLSDDDIIVIVDENSSTAMSNNGGSSSSPSAIAVTISGSNLTGAVPETIQWVFESPAANTYSFKQYGGSSNYLYCTNSNTGIRVGEGAANTFNITSDFLYNIGQERYLGKYASGSDWRSYTTKHANISATVYGFYKKTEVALSSYSITITPPSNGTVTTTPASTAYESSTVTINATPSDGYAVSSVNVTEGGTPVATSPVDATHYSFTMPSGDVTVSVTFARVYTISTSATNGTIEVSPATTAMAGETITITATPSVGYTFSSWSVTGATPASTTTSPTTFTMPANDVSVSATFVSAKTISRLVASIDDVPAAGVSGEILASAYSLTNAVESDLTVTYDNTVVTDAINDNGSIMYDVAANAGGARSGWIRIAVTGGNTIQIDVNQLGSFVPVTVWDDDFSNCTQSTTALTSLSGSKVGFTSSYSGVSYIYPESSAIKFASGSYAGTLTTPAFTALTSTSKVTVTIKAVGMNAKTGPLTWTVNNAGTASKTSQSLTASSQGNASGVSSWDTVTFTITGATSATTITFNVAKGKQVFVNSINIVTSE